MRFDPNERIGDYPTLMQRIDEQSLAPDLTETLVQDAPPVRPASPRRTMIAALLSFAAISLIFGVLFWGRGSAPIGPPALIETVWSQPLFDGESLSGWTNRQSVWSVKEDSEGSRVLAGKGTIATVIPNPPPDVTRSAIATGIRVRIDLQSADSCGSPVCLCW